MKLSELIEKYGDCEVKEELVNMVEPKGEWKPKRDNDYWCIDSCGCVSYERWLGTDGDFFRLARRNVYQTREETVFALEMYNFCKERSIEPDWEDMNQSKYYLCLNHGDKEVNYNCRNWLDGRNPFYYPSEEVVQEVINKYSFEELAKYYGRV